MQEKLCDCHGEPMMWINRASRASGGYHRCRVKSRERDRKSQEERPRDKSEKSRERKSGGKDEKSRDEKREQSKSGSDREREKSKHRAEH